MCTSAENCLIVLIAEICWSRYIAATETNSAVKMCKQ